MEALAADVRALRARLEAQEAELAALRASRTDPPVSRRHLLAGLAGLGAAGVASVIAAEPAAAADGDNLVVGTDNVSTSPTKLTHTATGGFNEFGMEYSSTGRATLAVGAEDNPSITFDRYAIWTEMRSERFGDSAIRATAKDGFAVNADCTSDLLPTIAGTNHGMGAGLGGASTGGGAQLYLEPAPDSPLGAPSSGERPVGQIKLDRDGDLWVCVEAGTPGTWTRLLREDTAPGRVIPIAPVRILDTRLPGGQGTGGPVVPGQTPGPLSSGQAVTLDLAGVAPFPARASGVVGNAIVVAPTKPGRLQIFPAGSTPSTSTVNFSTNTNEANGFTSGLSSDGLRAVALLLNGPGTYHLVIDVTAYIT